MSESLEHYNLPNPEALILQQAYELLAKTEEAYNDSCIHYANKQTIKTINNLESSRVDSTSAFRFYAGTLAQIEPNPFIFLDYIEDALLSRDASRRNLHQSLIPDDLNTIQLVREYDLSNLRAQQLTPREMVFPVGNMFQIAQAEDTRRFTRNLEIRNFRENEITISPSRNNGKGFKRLGSLASKFFQKQMGSTT